MTSSLDNILDNICDPIILEDDTTLKQPPKNVSIPILQNTPCRRKLVASVDQVLNFDCTSEPKGNLALSPLWIKLQYSKMLLLQKYTNAINIMLYNSEYTDLNVKLKKIMNGVKEMVLNISRNVTTCINLPRSFEEVLNFISKCDPPHQKRKNPLEQLNWINSQIIKINNIRKIILSNFIQTARKCKRDETKILHIQIYKKIYQNNIKSIQVYMDLFT